MNFLITLIAFIFVLGITVLVHEFGHFIFAKKAGVYVYEFSIGMGPSIKKFKRKNDETVYSLRLLPIGGYVQMAGEEIEVDENIPKEKRMQAKSWVQRFMIMVAGVMMNFVLAIVILFVIGLIKGAPNLTPEVSFVESNSSAERCGLKKGDIILSFNNKKILSLDHLALEFQIASSKESTMIVKHSNGEKETIEIKPEKVEENGKVRYKYGIEMKNDESHGFISALKYAFTKFFSLVHQMLLIIWYLITRVLSLSNLSGPVGIFTVVGDTVKTGLINLIYLTGYICINVGLINLLPIPGFDGGHVLFLIIEKIKGSPVDSKVENVVHTIFLGLLMILMVIITFNDILRIFG